MNVHSSIRKASPDDASEIARLCHVLGYSASQTEITTRLAEILANPNHFVAVATNGESDLVAWIAAEHRIILASGERCEVVGIVVDNGSRRRGIGAGLIRAAEQWAFTKGLSHVFIRSNIVREESHAFFRSRGYVEKKTQKAYEKEVVERPA